MSAKNPSPKRKPQPKGARDFFVRDRGVKSDAKFHDPIIAGGDQNAARKASRAVMHRLGISAERIDALLGQPPKRGKGE